MSNQKLEIALDALARIADESEDQLAATIAEQALFTVREMDEDRPSIDGDGASGDHAEPGEIGRRVEIRAKGEEKWLRYYVDYESADSVTLSNHISGPLGSSAVLRKTDNGLYFNGAGQLWELREL